MVHTSAVHSWDMKHLGGLDKTQETKVSAVSTACCALSLHCTTGCICNPNLWWTADRFILPAGDLEVLQTSSLANHRIPFRKRNIWVPFYKRQNLHFFSFSFIWLITVIPRYESARKKRGKKCYNKGEIMTLKKLRQGCMLTPECSRSCASKHSNF